MDWLISFEEQGENQDDAIVVDTCKTETEDADYNQVWNDTIVMRFV